MVRQFSAGRDKKEHVKFQATTAFLQRGELDTLFVEQLARRKRAIRYLQGNIFERFWCYLNGEHPIFRWYNLKRFYGNFSTQGGVNPDQADS